MPRPRHVLTLAALAALTALTAGCKRSDSPSADTASAVAPGGASTDTAAVQGGVADTNMKADTAADTTRR